MMKKLFMGFLVLGLMLGLVALVNSGCTTTTSSSTPTDPGRIASSEVTISGGATYNASTGIIDVNLNAILTGTDETLAVTTGNVHIFVGTDLGSITGWEYVEFSLPTVDDRPMDMVFILDNTGSMASRIQAVKDSISAFAATLEAAGLDIAFGVVSFGDTSGESSSLDLPASAEAVASWLAALSGVGGGDWPENPLDAIELAYNTFSWRTGTQRVFIVITDNACHQAGDGTAFTTTSVATVSATLSGNAVVYAVSPKMYSGTGGPWGYTGCGDVRWLADGYGWFEGVSLESYGVVKPRPGTGGLWVELPATGDIDLTTLGISGIVSGGVTLRFGYTFSAGTWYIHVLADTDGDGVFDSDLLIPITISASGVSSSGVQQEVIGVRFDEPN